MGATCVYRSTAAKQRDFSLNWRRVNDASLSLFNMKSLLVLTILLIVFTTGVVRNDGFLEPNDVDKFNGHTAKVDVLKGHYKSEDFHGGPSGDGSYAGGGF
ncbi:hypothetical protein FOZ63_005500 [Perkinsus olseni]|uniref:Uncharacterized protein n=1 Tax=Perkinsus olseni TaxID=32597 RepID=A0A7J6PTY7_PEROL|nr:hypothetical protein FOZ62_004915 [Perkinsus olseni]KAF4752499.1 hypothetical protein FOZ63_005500 [Perkinsus olseni]